jgi:hypothetical protein
MPPRPIRRVPGRSYAGSDGETALHVACAGWLSMRLIPPTFFTTFPAGGGGLRRGQQLKRMGLKPGMPDILIFDRRIINNVLYPLTFGIELKTSDGRTSGAQRATHRDLCAVGVRVAVVRSIPDLRQALHEWEIPIKSVTPAQERLQSLIEAWHSWDGIASPDMEV